MDPGVIRSVRLLLWLRFRIMFRGGRGRGVALVIACATMGLFSLLAAGFIGDLTLAFRATGNPRLPAAWVHLFLLLVYAALVLLPLLGFAASEFYDVTKLFHFPVSHRAVFTARVLGLLAGPSVLFFAPSLVAVVIGLPGGVGTGLLRGVLLVVFLFHAVTVAEVLQLMLLHVLRSRRFRDLAAVASALVAAGFYVLFQLGMRNGSPARNLAAFLDRGFTDYLAPIPCYWVSSLVAPGAGAGAVLLFLFGLLPLTGLLVVLAGHLQEKAFHGEIPIAVPRERAVKADRPRPAPFPLSLVPGAVRALAGQQWRALARDPAVKSLLIQQTVFVLLPVALPLLASSRGRMPGWGMLGKIGIGGVAFVASQLCLNLFGLEGPGVVQLLVTPVSRRRMIAGKVLGTLALGVLLLAGFLLLLGGVFLGLGAPPRPADLLVLFLNGGAALLIVSAVGAVTSVISPFRVAVRGRGALAQQRVGAQEGCLRTLVIFLGLAVAAVLAAPVFLLAGAPGSALLGLAWGVLLLVLGVGWAGGLLRGREEEILRALAP